MTSVQSQTEEILELLDGLIYADVFDCAVTLDELWRYSRVPIGRDALERRLHDDPCLRELVIERDGLYCLADRPGLLDLRPKRMARALELDRRARRVASVLKRVPFVRGVVLTGSVAANDAPADADVDLLVVVARGRLGTAFLLLGSASRLLGRQVFCPNFYVTEDALGIDPNSLYVAHEVAQARILVGDARIVRRANPWLSSMFPNAAEGSRVDQGIPAGSRVQQLLEVPLAGRLGDRFEQHARHVALTRLRAHYGARRHGVPTDVLASFEAGRALRFHRGEIDRAVLQRYEARAEQVAAALKGAEPRSAPITRA